MSAFEKGLLQVHSELDEKSLARRGSSPPPTALGAGLVKIDAAWTRFETWFVVVVLALEILSLTLWIFLKGMSTPPDSDSAAGIVFRALVGATALGLLAFLALGRYGERARRWGAVIGTVSGIFLAKAWVGVGVAYASNLLNWFQQASVLTLFGGLRGIGTQLTLLLALLGGSLATARGKHITIDLVTRSASQRVRVVLLVASWGGAAVICIAAAWGFFDHIAIEKFGAKADASVSMKLGAARHELGEHWFMLRKQIALDTKSVSHIVLRGQPYANWLRGGEWNAWLGEQGFVERYGDESVKSLRIGEGELRSPMIVIPGVGEPRGELSDTANLVVPIGFLVIALRFLFRALLVVSGHATADPDDEEFSEGSASDVPAASA